MTGSWRFGKLLLLAVLFPLSHSPSSIAWAQTAGASLKTTSRATCNRAQFRVVVDVGHTAEVPGATSARSMKGLTERVTRANSIAPDLFLSVHHDSVPEYFLERWEYAGAQHHFSDRFKGHSLFISYENSQPQASLHFAQLLGDELKARGLQYASHYTQPFMGHRRRDLLDAEAGVYRFDALIVLRKTQMPAVLLEAGSIVNREEELA